MCENVKEDRQPIVYKDHPWKEDLQPHSILIDGHRSTTLLKCKGIGEKEETGERSLLKEGSASSQSAPAVRRVKSVSESESGRVVVNRNKYLTVSVKISCYNL
jgi:hypothetical protein